MRNKLTKILAVCLPTLFAGVSWAGQNVGNGGLVAAGTCDGTDPNKQVLVVLDFYEVMDRWNVAPSLGDVSLTVAEKIELAIARLDRLDPLRGTLYRQWTADFWSESQPQPPRIPMSPIRDKGDIRLPERCVVAKVVDQFIPEFPLDKRYAVNMELFNRLDNDSKAGLILHEVVYRDAIARGHQTSKMARVFTGLLASTHFETLTPQEYAQLKIDTGMAGYMILGESSGSVIRCFDEEPLAKMDAAAFCGELRGSSGMTYLAISNINISPIGRHILGDDETGKVSYWGHVGNPFIFPSNDQLVGPLPTERLPFVCYQNNSDSPWTTRD